MQPLFIHTVISYPYWLMAKNTEVTISNGQSSGTEKLATLGEQDTRRYWAQNTLQIQTKHKPQHRKFNTDPTNQYGEPRNPGSRKSKQFLFLIRYMQCDSYS